MSSQRKRTLPKAVFLATQEVDEEMVAYRLRTKEAFTFNPSSRIVWEHCDGESTLAQVSREIEERFDLEKGAGEPAVWASLRRFQKLGLLEDGAEIRDDKCYSSRRRFLKVFATSAAAVPVVLVTSLSSPAAAQSGFVDCATSCTPTCIAVPDPADAPTVCADLSGGFPECASTCPGTCYPSPGCTGGMTSIVTCVDCLSVPMSSWQVNL